VEVAPELLLGARLADDAYLLRPAGQRLLDDDLDDGL